MLYTGHFNQYEGRSPVNREFQPEARNRAPGSNYFGRGSLEFLHFSDIAYCINFLWKVDNVDFDSQAESQVDERNVMDPSLFSRSFTKPNNFFKFNRGPVANFFNRLSVNRAASKSDTIRSPFESCTSLTGEFGICSSRAVCSHFGGRSSGVCNANAVCCISMSAVNVFLWLNLTIWICIRLDYHLRQ